MRHPLAEVMVTMG